MERAKQILHESQVDMMQMAPKSFVGIVGTFGALSINDIVGIVVGVLTGIYMVLQIEAALRKRKEAIRRLKEQDSHEHKN